MAQHPSQAGPAGPLARTGLEPACHWRRRAFEIWRAFRTGPRNSRGCRLLVPGQRDTRAGHAGSAHANRSAVAGWQNYDRGSARICEVNFRVRGRAYRASAIARRCDVAAESPCGPWGGSQYSRDIFHWVFNRLSPFNRRFDSGAISGWTIGRIFSPQFSDLLICHPRTLGLSLHR